MTKPAAKRILTPPRVLERACLLLRALTHPHRLQICELLLDGDFTVGQIAEALGLRPNVVSQHLNHLRAHGVVEPQRDGRRVYYRVVHESAGWLLNCIRSSAAGFAG